MSTIIRRIDHSSIRGRQVDRFENSSAVYTNIMDFLLRVFDTGNLKLAMIFFILGRVAASCG